MIGNGHGQGRGPAGAGPDLLALFRGEVETNTSLLADGLLALERGGDAASIESMMRAAHSIKGAARIVGVESATGLAHVMEDCFVAVQRRTVELRGADVDTLLRATDVLQQISRSTDAGGEGLAGWETRNAETLRALVASLTTLGAGAAGPASVAPVQAAPAPAPRLEAKDRVVRVAATDVDRMVGLAGEALIEARQLHPFVDALRAISQKHNVLSSALDELGVALRTGASAETLAALLQACRTDTIECRQLVAESAATCDAHARRLDDSTSRLYRDVVGSRMRPFSDVLAGFPRMVRDLARQLGKQVRLEITGEVTRVDRDVLDRLEAPLNHLLRNAVDHALEAPGERLAAGKTAEGCIRIEARHRAGVLLVSVIDDGRGIDAGRIRDKAVERGLVTPDLAARLTPPELLDFIFLPGLSTARAVTEISGRGVGLDVVQTMVQELGGSVRVFTDLGRGTRFQLQLPITLSVIRAVVVEIAGEAYAFPLSRIDRIARIDRREVQTLQGRPYFSQQSQHIGLLEGHDVLGLEAASSRGDELSVLVLGDRAARHGLVVDRFLGEHDLVVRRLDPRLGKIPDISAAAIMNDGLPLLIVDVDDLLRSIERALQGTGFAALRRAPADAPVAARKRVLVVDDSITVRELQRHLLINRGYEVATAIDGMDGWNSIRGGRFDLVISDIDMPRMNGIELIKTIRQDDKLRTLPVVIVSYKDRPEDRLQGLEAGANSYFTKSSFHDDTLIHAIEDLIGAP